MIVVMTGANPPEIPPNRDLKCCCGLGSGPVGATSSDATSGS